MNCPSCNNENIQKLSIIHSSGLSSLETSSTGIGVGSDSLGAGFINTSGTHQTALSEQTSPPKKLNYFHLLIICGIIFVIGMLFIQDSFPVVLVIWSLLSAGGTLWVLNKAYDFNHNAYSKKYELWNKKFMCLRCGEVFKL